MQMLGDYTVHAIEPSVDQGQPFEIYDQDRLFRNKIYYNRFKESLIDRLYSYVLENKDSLGSHNYQLAGKIEEEYTVDVRDTDFGAEFMTELKGHMENVVRTPIKNYTMEAMWVNMQKQHEFNPVHSHSGVFSFVMYLDIPEIIRKEAESETFQTSSYNRGCIEFVSPFTNDVLTFNPKTYDFFLFHASHPHCVNPFRSDATRVSVSGNIIDVSLS